MESWVKTLPTLYEELKSLGLQKSDDSEPFKYKYEAIEKYKNLILASEEFSSNGDNAKELKLLKLICMYQIGVLCIETEDLSGGEKALNESLQGLKEENDIEKHAVFKLNCLINLGMLWSQRDNPEKSLEIFLEAERFYHGLNLSAHKLFFDLSNYFVIGKPSDIPLSENVNTLDVIEKLYTHIMFYLAQVYGTLNEPFKSAKYCHCTLERQIISKDYESLEWSLNAATISRYFTSKKQFVIARNHLAYAEHVLNSYGQSRTFGANTDENEEEDLYQHRKAQIARLWLKYGIDLLEASYEKIKSNDGSGSADIENIDEFLFTGLPVKHIEDQVTAQYVRVYSEARLLFLNCQKWYKSAIQYFSLEEYASISVEISDDFCEAYRYLASFEDDPARQCKMHKRRIDIMEDLLKQLNSDYYYMMCQHLRYAAGEAYYSMVMNKLSIISNKKPPFSNAFEKVNSLCKKSIGHFKDFIEFSKDKKSNEKEIKFNPSVAKVVMVAYFRLGLLYNKLIHSTNQEKAESLRKSIEYYEFILAYCKDHEEVAKDLVAELEVCQEMTRLLPVRLARLTTGVDKE